VRTTRSKRTIFVAALVALLVGAPAGVGYAAYQHDSALRGRLPSGTRVAGVDVSRLDRAAATAKVRAAVERDFDRPASFVVAGHTYTTTLRRLGVTDDVDAAVAKAFRQATKGNWLTRAWHRTVDGTDAPRVVFSVTDYAPEKLDAFVAGATKEVYVAPVDAQVKRFASWLAFTPSKTGLALDAKAAADALRASLADGQPRILDRAVVQPKVKEVATAILVRTGDNHLYLYQHGHITKTYGVATGSPRYPTPYGRFEVVLKRYLPTWVNPHSVWSRNEPERIGPGPNNPLGTRAMNLSAPGIRIHGTPSDSSIGYSVSHGCIRMHMPDVEALYELVPKGTPVFIVKAGPPRFRSSAPANDTANAADGG